MAVLGVNHVNFHADPTLIEAMMAFYRDAVGLEVGLRPPFKDHGYWLYACGAPVVHLYVTVGSETRRMGADTTFDHFAFTCRDLPGVEAALAKLGVAHRRSFVPATGITQIFLVDPAGNRVELQFSETAG